MDRIRLALFTLLAASFSTSVPGQNLPTGFLHETLISSGLTAPHDFCFLPDGRVLIANRPGQILLYTGTTTVTPVGTVPNVQVGGERGLLSIEADPAFASNGYVYVWYSSSLDTYMHLDRFTCTGALSNPSSTNLSFAASSRRVLLDAVPDVAFNHNGGSVRFGPDGMLYLSIGDDAFSCGAQSTTSQRGCLLRMDTSGLPAGGSSTAPGYSALDPGNNPLSANTDFSQLLIANGLRNPFRMEIDQVTGNCYIGDVGQNAIEEYSEYVYPTTGPLPLVNFGWPWREGNNNYSGCGGTPPQMTAPIATVGHGAGWAAIMGGPRYRNQGGPFDFGTAYEGVAFFADYYAGQVRCLQNTGSGWATLPPVAGQPGAWWATGLLALTSLRQGPDGALYLTRRNGLSSTSGGTFERVRPLGPQNSVAAISGGGQRARINETFPQPLVARVLDPGGAPLPNGTIDFTVAGGATLSTTNPVIADANGYAQTTVTATGLGGSITVTASTPGAGATATFDLFARKLSVINAGSLTVVTIANQTAAVPAVVPYVVMVGFPGVPTWISPVGPVCTDPASPLTVVIEDGTGVFGYVSLSGTGGTGTPGLTKVYSLAPGLLTGLQLKVTAVGVDAVDGIFVMNCVTQQF